MKGKAIIWLVIIAVVVIIGIMVYNNSDSTDSYDDSTGDTQDEMPEGEVSDLSSDDEVFTGIDDGVENF